MSILSLYRFTISAVRELFSVMCRVLVDRDSENKLNISENKGLRDYFVEIILRRSNDANLFLWIFFETGVVRIRNVKLGLKIKMLY